MLPNNQKGRYWAFCLYPDSAPAEWKDILQKTGLAIAISPFHDSDLNADDSIKKPHYHVILCWDGPTTYKNVLNVTQQLNGTIPIKLEAVRGYYRYLTHKDNPEKHQYDDKDIVLLNSFNPEDYDQPTERELDIIAKDILCLIVNNKIIEYSDLMDTLIYYEMHEHFRFARRNTIFLDAYIKSMRHKPLPDPRSDTPHPSESAAP